MNRLSKSAAPIAAALASLVLILDSRTAMNAAAEAVELCLRTAIPSLFPFFVLSAILVPFASRLRLRKLGDLLNLDPGWEAIFLLGCLGGYPVGAQCVAQGYASGKLNPAQARRMLGFCTNCGPSFLFGIVGAAFERPIAAWIIAVISVHSAMMVGILWPGKAQNEGSFPDLPSVTVPQAVQRGIRSMGSVCAWIILGKVLLAFGDKWVLSSLPDRLRLLITGLLELTNGCLTLKTCSDERFRFVLACVMVTFGGLCVAMQVSALCSDAGLDDAQYLPQKALQALLAGALAILCLTAPVWLTVFIFASGPILCKMTVEIPKKVVYNVREQRRDPNAVSKKDRPFLPVLHLRNEAGR